ncbi:unnamed protein product, partial [Darwinula stevensoni]
IRTIRWLDRCLAANQRPTEQNLFPIVQGGLHEDLRTICVQELLKRDVSGYAIGGLSGGESKDRFWKIVHHCTNLLPKEKPRYLMGVGVAVDLIVCSALGVDMFDCVFPTRTARFGCALIESGQLNLKNIMYAKDFSPLDPECNCSTCRNHTRAYLHSIATDESVSSHLLSTHNIAFQVRLFSIFVHSDMENIYWLYLQMKLMRNIQENISAGTFPEYVMSFMRKNWPLRNYPQWAVDALKAVNIDVE